MVLSRKEKEQLEVMIALEKLIKEKGHSSPEGIEAGKSWHCDFPEKLKEIRRNQF